MKKGLVIALVVLALVGAIIVCKGIDNSQQSQWTQSSEQLLKLKKMPKKPLTKSNLFE